MTESPERHFWTLIEPIHAITYFAPECQEVFEAAGLKGFWRGYFGGRAAPLGAVGAGPILALFFGFHQDFVARAVPDIWQRCSPIDALGARLAGVDAAWSVHVERVDKMQLKRAAFILRIAAESVADDRRPMFQANLAIDAPTEPHLALWHWATVLREHRGDGHLIALGAHAMRTSSGSPARASLLKHSSRSAGGATTTGSQRSVGSSIAAQLTNWARSPTKVLHCTTPSRRSPTSWLANQ